MVADVPGRYPQPGWRPPAPPPPLTPLEHWQRGYAAGQQVAYLTSALFAGLAAAAAWWFA